MKDYELLVPESVDAAVATLGQRRGAVLVLAGGTDVMVRARRRLIPPEVEAKVAAVDGVSSATVELVWDPPWGPELMSEAARLELGMDL